MMRSLATFFLIGILFGSPREAFAYIDPTAGGLIIQALLAGLAGLGVVTKLYWKKFVSFFNKRTKHGQVE